MANLGQTFNANDVEPASSMEVIAAGKYTAQIVNSEMRGTKDGNGQYLWLEIDILEGEYKGRKLWDRLNLVNGNSEAVRIANQTLSAICHAVEVMSVHDSEQLHYKPFTVNVRVRPAGPDKTGTMRDAQNEIRGYSKANGAGGQRPAAAAAAGVGGAKSPPWRR
jgi:hypothetical protein